MPSSFGLGMNKHGGGSHKLEGVLSKSGTKTGSYTVTDSKGKSATANVFLNIASNAVVVRDITITGEEYDSFYIDLSQYATGPDAPYVYPTCIWFVNTAYGFNQGYDYHILEASQALYTNGLREMVYNIYAPDGNTRLAEGYINLTIEHKPLPDCFNYTLPIVFRAGEYLGFTDFGLVYLDIYRGSFSASNLPYGVYLLDDGRFYGEPGNSDAGKRTITVTFTASTGQTQQKDFQLEVKALPKANTIFGNSTSATIFSPVSITFTVASPVVEWSIKCNDSSKAAQFAQEFTFETINSTTAKLSGMGTTAIQYNLTVSAKDPYGRTATKNIAVSISYAGPGSIKDSGHVEVSLGVTKTIGFTIPRKATWGSSTYALIFKPGGDITAEDTNYAYKSAALADRGLAVAHYKPASVPTAESMITVSMNASTYAISIELSTGENVSTANFNQIGWSNGFVQGTPNSYVGVALVQFFNYNVV